MNKMLISIKGVKCINCNIKTSLRNIYIYIYIYLFYLINKQSYFFPVTVLWEQRKQTNITSYNKNWTVPNNILSWSILKWWLERITITKWFLFVNQMSFTNKKSFFQNYILPVIVKINHHRILSKKFPKLYQNIKKDYL